MRDFATDFKKAFQLDAFGGGCQPTILPKFSRTMKLQTFWAIGACARSVPLLDPPLQPVFDVPTNTGCTAGVLQRNPLWTDRQT